MKGLTIQERRVLIVILLALAVGAVVKQWRRQGNGESGVGKAEASLEQGAK